MDDKNPESIPIKNLRTEDGAHELATSEKHAALPSAVEGGPTIGANEHIPSCHSRFIAFSLSSVCHSAYGSASLV